MLGSAGTISAIVGKRAKQRQRLEVEKSKTVYAWIEEYKNGILTAYTRSSHYGGFAFHFLLMLFGNGDLFHFCF